MERLETVPFGTSVEKVMELFRRDGGVILKDLLTAEQVAAVNRDIEPYVEAHPCGTLKDDPIAKAFWGANTKRLTNMITLSRTYRECVIDNDTTLSYVSEAFRGVSDTLWLQSSQLIEIQPGEKAQFLHRDMGNYPVFNQFGPSGPEVTVNLILALSKCTEEAGATRIIPGSHRWDFSVNASAEMTIPAELESGCAVFYGGKVLHGGGANKTKDVKRRVISSGFNPGFLVPEEAYPFVVPMELVRQMSPRMQRLIGFRSFHQRNPLGGSLWQHNYEELADHLKL